MDDQKFLCSLEKLLDQFSSQIGSLVIDLGLLNDVFLEISRRKKDLPYDL